MKRSLVDAMRMIENIKSWFSLAHKHKDIRVHRMAYLAQFSIPALLNPMIRRTKRPPYCFDVLMRSMLPMIGPRRVLILVLMSTPFSLAYTLNMN